MITFSQRFKKRFKKKRVSRQPWRWAKVFLIFPVVLAGAFLIFLITLNLKIGQERAKLQEARANLQQELFREQAKREELLSKISQAGTREYLVKVALEDFNLRPLGTKVVAFVLKEKTEEEEKDEEETFWGKISDWLLEKLKIK